MDVGLLRGFHAIGCAYALGEHESNADMHQQAHLLPLQDAVLKELDVHLDERLEVDLRNGGTHTPDFLKINPAGQVPVIVHDGTTITESAAITLYLGETFGVKAGVFPVEGPLRGEAMRWVIWAAVNLPLTAGKLMNPNADPEESKKAKEALDGFFTVLNDALTGKEYLIGNSYTLIDTHLFMMLAWIQFLYQINDKFSNLKRWLSTIGQRPVSKSKRQ